MKNYQVDIKFIDATEWQELTWYNSGGTRAKKVLQDANSNEFYFKCSEKKPAKNGKAEKYYKYEFWNEIIAYQLGTFLGLKMLRYDVALFNGELGCISPKMTITGDEQLVEVGRFMTAINSNFLPEDYKTRNQYSFQLLVDTLSFFKLEGFMQFFLETLLFDALIGNTDRHQENWAFIGKTTNLHEIVNELKHGVKTNVPNNFIRSVKKLAHILVANKKNTIIQEGIYKLIHTKVDKTAPIYDSGSSLARELTEERVRLLLLNVADLEKYISNGKSELHWNGIKISHFNLVAEMLNTAYHEQVLKAAIFLEKWDESIMKKILLQLGAKIPAHLNTYCITEDRKLLIIKMLTLRYSKLKTILKP